MPAVIGRALLAAAAFAALAGPAGAVGLGPLVKEGNTDSSIKGFYLTLMNPYNEPLEFTAQAIGYESEDPATRVTIFPSILRLGGGQNLRLLVVAHDLAPGETYQFRVCAERVQPPSGVVINARVCSKLTAHRLLIPGTGASRDS